MAWIAGMVHERVCRWGGGCVCLPIWVCELCSGVSYSHLCTVVPGASMQKCVMPVCVGAAQYGVPCLNVMEDVWYRVCACCYGVLCM